MLAVRACFSPNNRTGRVVYFVSVAINTFTVTFHIPLLKIRGKAMHILIIRQNCFALSTKKVGIPDANKSHYHGYVRREFGGSKMLINRKSSPQQLFEIIIAYSK